MATSDLIAGIFEDLPAEDPAVSQWNRVEFASLLEREVRMGELDAAAAHEANSRFEAMIEQSFMVLLTDCDDFVRAREWLSRSGTAPPLDAFR